MLPLTAYHLTPPVSTFELPLQGTSNTSVGVRTGAGELVWKSYNRIHPLASIRYEQRLLAGLAAAGLSFAVPAPLLTQEGALLCCGPQGWGALSARLPGTPLDPYNLDQVEQLGAATGELLAALQGFSNRPRPGRTLFDALFDFPPPERNPITLTPAQLGLPDQEPFASLLAWWREEAARLQAFVVGPYRALPRQLCHNDLAPANVLVEGVRVSAVLDFEFATPAARALDVAMGLRMTMRVWENDAPWEAARRFCCGYRRWMPLAEAEIAALPWLIRLRSAIPVLWWLGRASALGGAETAVRGMGYLQNCVRWMDANGGQLVEEVLGTMGRG
jgi:Ser/Thr protein kinase RdoA (MazF antagonist)